MNMHGNYTFVLASGEKCRQPYKEAFGYDDDHIVIGSLPRVDALKSEEFKRKTLEKINRVYPQLVSKKDGKKIVVYAPTFRTGRNITREIMEMAKAFDRDEYTLVIKKHPLMETPDLDWCIVDEEFSTMEMLVAADYVVCDYSAIVYEAALLAKPLFFYGFDLADYTGARDFYLDYEAEMPGPVAMTGEALAAFVEADYYEMDKVEAFAREYVNVQEDCTAKLAQLVLTGTM